MKKFILFLVVLVLVGQAIGQTKYFLPVPVESSNGRPIINQNVDLYKNGVKVADLTWHNAGRYYYTDTTVVTPGAYDIYVNGIEWQDNTYINYGATTGATIAAVVSDSISFPFDSTAIKLLNMDKGRVAYMRQLSTTNEGGGGIFIAMDSTALSGISGGATITPDGGCIFSHPSIGTFWVRDEYLNFDMINVLWYGATRDSSTNSTDAFRAAKKRAFKTGADIFVPGGDYKISSGAGDGKFFITGSMSLIGQGRYQLGGNRPVTNLYPAADGDTILMGASQTYHSVDGDGVIIKNIHVNGIAGTDSAKIGIFFHNSQDLVLENVIGENITRADTAVFLKFQGNDAVRMTGIMGYRNDINVYIDGVTASTVNGIYMKACRFIDPKLIGAYIEQVTTMSMDAVGIEANWGLPDFHIPGGNLVNVSGDKWYYVITADPTSIEFNGVTGTEVGSSTLVDSEGEWFYTSAGSDSLFIYTSDTSTVEWKGNRAAQAPHRNELYRAIVCSYAQMVNIINCYYESGWGVGTRYIDVIPYPPDPSSIGWYTNINIFGGHVSDQATNADPNNLPSYPININSHQNCNLNLYGTQIDQGVGSKPIAVKDSTTYAVNLYNCMLGSGSWPASGRPFTVIDYDSASFTFTPGYANTFGDIGELQAFYGPVRFFDDGGFIDGIRSDGMRDNKSTSSPSYRKATSNVISKYISGSGASWDGTRRYMTLDSLIDTVDVSFVRINDGNDWTQFYVDMELSFSRYNGSAGQAFEIKYRQLDDGGTNRFQFEIDTLYSTNTNNARFDTIYVSSSSDDGATITLVPDSLSKGTPNFYLMGEVLYSRNVYADSTLMDVRGD